MAYYGLFSWIRMVPGSVLEDMLKDAGNCACDVWPLATHQRRSSLTSSLAEANGKHCNARLLREFQAPLPGCVSKMFFQVSWPPIVEYCRWGVRRSAGIVVRSAVNIQWDELKQIYSSKELM